MLHAVARSRFVTWFPAVSGVLSLQAAAAAAPNTTQPAAAPLRDEPYTGPPTVFTTPRNCDGPVRWGRCI